MRPGIGRHKNKGNVTHKQMIQNVFTVILTFRSLRVSSQLKMLVFTLCSISKFQLSSINTLEGNWDV